MLRLNNAPALLRVREFLIRQRSGKLRYIGLLRFCNTIQKRTLAHAYTVDANKGKTYGPFLWPVIAVTGA